MSGRRANDSCPHCGQPVGLSWWALVPSTDRRRQLKCRACGKEYDLSDASKMASMLGGHMGMGLTFVLLFGRIVKAGGGSKLYIALATAILVAGFGLGATILARIGLRLVAKP